jgi:Sec-independent protein translocase protein TatA
MGITWKQILILLIVVILLFCDIPKITKQLLKSINIIKKNFNIKK